MVLYELLLVTLLGQMNVVTPLTIPNKCIRPFVSLSSSSSSSSRRRNYSLDCIFPQHHRRHHPLRHQNHHRKPVVRPLFASSPLTENYDDDERSYNNANESELSNNGVLPYPKLEQQQPSPPPSSSSTTTRTTSSSSFPNNTDQTVNFSKELGEFDPSKKIPLKREGALVGDPQQKVVKEKYSVSAILKELAAIQQQGPQKYCILGTRHCSFLHQQIIELLSYALVLSENHVYTSGAMGTNAAAIRGALRAGRDDLLTVILPQSLSLQPPDSQALLREVTDLVSMPQNDEMNLDVASRLCNSKLLSETDQLVAFAFHESTTVIEAMDEAKKLDMLVTTLFLD